MNRKATLLFSLSLNAASLLGLMSNSQATENAMQTSAQTAVQKMEPIIVSATYLPAENAVKLERIVVTAKRDLSDVRSDMKPEPIARVEAKSASAPASL